MTDLVAVGARLVEAFDLLESDRSPEAAPLRALARLGLAMLNGTTSPRPVLASFGEPGRRRQVWLLRFEDAEVGDVTFDEAIYGAAEAEVLARDAYATSSQQWNCTLFRIADDQPGSCDDVLRRARAEIERLSGDRPNEIATEIAVQVGDVAPELASAESILTAWRSGFSGVIRKARRAHEEAVERRERHERYRKLDPESANDPDYFADYDEKVAETAAELAACEETARQIEIDPMGQLLPIGTVVRIAKAPPSSYPVPSVDTVGVVVGYRTTSDRPNLVTFADDVVDNMGGTYHFDDDRMWSVWYRADELEVLSHSTLVGEDSPNLVPGYRATHVHEGPDPENRILWGHDMLFEALGWTWRVQLINGLPERTQLHRETSYFLEWMKPWAERTR